ncbi:MAG TPA: formate dehydrogenase accessory protein FdhE [Candidatus Binatia bacterium]|nr:formate dehydrogenase accessory protein FdhE [Candidatus Binatia bacterium]
MAGVVLEAATWSKRRKRTEELKGRWPFATEVLAFYGLLLDVQEAAYQTASRDLPQPSEVAAYAAERIVPRVVEVSIANGPPAMSASVLEKFHETDFEAIVRRWLRGEDLSSIERYLARAATSPVLEALGKNAAEACEGPRDERHCPTCGGLPQLSYFAASPEDLVTAHRYLECSRCATAWPYPRMTCAACGESDTARLLVYSEIGTAQAEVSGKVIKETAGMQPAHPPNAQFPHVRVDGCDSCSHYLLTIDLERDGRAVPLVDEIAAIPLDLYAKEHGMSKIVPNLVGF